MSEELKPAFIEDDPQPPAEEIARLKVELARKLDAAEAEIRSHRSMEPESAMTDEELSRLLTNFHYAILDSLGQAPVQLDEDGEHRTVDASRAAIHAHFDRRKEGEDAERLSARITEYLCAGGLWNPECMEHDKVRRLLIDCRTEFDAAIADSAIKSAIAQVDAARTEGKGNG